MEELQTKEDILNIEQKNENNFEIAQTQEIAKKTKAEKLKKLLNKKDIRYKGPLTYRSLRIIGFTLMFFAQWCFVYNLLNKITDNFPDWYENFFNFLSIISSFSLPIFLASNFCVIMSNKNRIVKNLIFYTIMALLFYIMVILIYYRYLMGIFNGLLEDQETAQKISDYISNRIFKGLLTYNIFIDLALFSLFYFFLFYTPKFANSKKKFIIFRSFSFIPIIIVIASLVLFYVSFIADFEIPIAVLALLPCRPPTVYAIFIIISIIVKIRQKKFIEYGATTEQYEKYLKTKRNSFEISAITSIVIFVVCLVDFLLLIINTRVVLFNLGINFYLVVAIPFIFLLSYNRQPKYKFIDILIPVIFVIAIVILYLEGILFTVNNI